MNVSFRLVARFLPLSGLILATSTGACGGGDDATDLFGASGGGNAGTSASAGAGSVGKGGSAAGAAGKGGATAGAGGSVAGAAGAAAGGVSGGTGGTNGDGGAAGGEAGAAGAGGAAEAGTGGTAGAAAGAAGTAGEGGTTAGTGASAGSGGAGVAGAGEGGGAGVAGAAGGSAGAGGIAGAGGSVAGTGGGAGAGAGGGAGVGAGGSGGVGAGGAVCGEATFPVSLPPGQVDLLLVIDNSASMTDEIQAVQAHLYDDLVKPLDDAGIDRHVVLIGRHGSAANAQSVCVSKPLSGHVCEPIPQKPTNTDRFLHYSTEIASTNSLLKLLAALDAPDEFGVPTGGVSSFLRHDTLKVILEISDDSTNRTPDEFEAALFLRPGDLFGTATDRRYVFHSLIGVADSETGIFLPSQIQVSSKCNTAVNTGTVYQQLSLRTGGLRMSICPTSKYGNMFQRVAAVTREKVAPVCAFPLLDASAGGPTDPTQIDELRLVSGTTSASLPRRAGKPSCDSEGFYLTGNRVELCPDSCAKFAAVPVEQAILVDACP
jgi:hypothetical protein